MAFKSTSVPIVYWTFCSGADHRNIKAPRHWPLLGEFTGDQWIPSTKVQWRGKYFHLTMSSWFVDLISVNHVSYLSEFVIKSDTNQYRSMICMVTMEIQFKPNLIHSKISMHMFNPVVLFVWPKASLYVSTNNLTKPHKYQIICREAPSLSTPLTHSFSISKSRTFGKCIETLVQRWVYRAITLNTHIWLSVNS